MDDEPDERWDMYQFLSALATVGIVTTIVSNRRSGEIIRQMSEAYSGSIRAAIGTGPETQAEYIARLEHECEIAGHEFDCPWCPKPKERKWMRHTPSWMRI